MMDGQRRKRKVEDEEESEEEKIKKFFALVRSTREVRERMTSGLLRAKAAEGKKKPIEEKQMGWNPTFQPEDFMVDAQLKIIDHGCLVAVGSSKEEEEKGKEKEGDGLNLNLSL